LLECTELESEPVYIATKVLRPLLLPGLFVCLSVCLFALASCLSGSCSAFHPSGVGKSITGLSGLG